MPIVRIGTETREYESGTSYRTIAADYQSQYEDDILLVEVNHKLRELHKHLLDDCELKFITARDDAGLKTYQRSATLMMLKAFYDVVGSEHIRKVEVQFSLGGGFYIQPYGDFELSQELLDRVKAKMQEYTEQRIPIMKRSVNTEDAVEMFHKHKMFDKEKLFRYRRVSRVNIYSLGGFEDYFYGYMVKDTSYIKYYDLIQYNGGFVLMMPTKKNPKALPPFEPQEKLFHILKASSNWGTDLGIANVGALNDTIAHGKASEMILIQEAIQEKKIGQLAEQIVAQKDKKIVMIAGPSSSGKTTFSHRLSIQLQALGKHPHPIGVDDYFVNREDSPKNPDGSYNYEILECLDVKQFNEDMTNLLAGETVELPRYNFITGRREYKGDYMTLGDDDILVIEGIHCLNDKLSYSLPKESKFKIYISALTQLCVDEHNRIPSTDGRLIRRMVRDARTRGASAADTIRMWPTVRKGEELNIFPYQEDADAMFNSASVYELAVLKQYAEPLLFGIDKESNEYQEAKRLLKFLDYFLGISSEDIPKNSIVREFIGGSCFRV